MEAAADIKITVTAGEPHPKDAVPYGESPHFPPNFESLAFQDKVDFIICKIDILLTRLLNKILHHPDFQKIEASWRGLYYLCGCSTGTAPIKIKFLDIKLTELAQSFQRAPDVEDSLLFNLVYNQEFGMPGGEPFGVLLCDYHIRHHPTKNHRVDDVELLTALSIVGAAAFAPVITSASPELFGVNSFVELERLRQLQKFSGQIEHARFNRFTRSEDSRFLGITLPRVLMRPPYLADNCLNLAFNYRENYEGLSHEKFCWGSSVYPFGEVLIRSFEQYGWFANITGVLQGEITCGVVNGLRNFFVETDPDEIIPRSGVEIAIIGQLEDDLRDAGFISLTVCKDTELLAFRSVPSIQVPQRYDKQIASSNARISSSLDNIFCVSRFAHYIKVQMRDKVGSYQTADEMEKKISEWLSRYATANDNASLEVKARYPLRDFGVEIKELAGRPGEFYCKLLFKPHFKVENMNVSLQLQMKISSTKNIR